MALGILLIIVGMLLMLSGMGGLMFIAGVILLGGAKARIWLRAQRK
ncbi:MAG: hypothetical protein RDU20_21215 [Desulfomonilaceae bacterium]|nr:hypothetical protein [Desulfomonilaceae bacterium]